MLWLVSVYWRLTIFWKSCYDTAVGGTKKINKWQSVDLSKAKAGSALHAFSKKHLNIVNFERI